MKEIKHKKKVFAKKVIDLVEPYMIPREIDRTKEGKKYKFDVDVRSLKSYVEKEKRAWIYWGSHHTIEKCLAFIDKTNLADYTDVRIVENKTGLVLKQFKL